MPKFGNTLPKMDDVFKSHPKPEVMKDLIAAHRLRAIDILQNVMPAKILEITDLIKQEENPSSPFYKGQIFELSYTKPKLSQPATGDAYQGAEVTSLTDKPVLPVDISALSIADAPEVGGVRMGQHWFEVVKVNENQMKCNEIVFRRVFLTTGRR
uniref:Uncharacterized protein n=1 Tax=Kwoniella dejecticola CBS 10117 TaxID=1296121 RepID=A0A1A5ZXB2_9TREE|nr:uncharacterized protein I303_07206 [Kwoniella dejecticola CBS 10117]OBR82446.1 hypothetical protein I303_07206 [Kwoniella dejecticola CBS 10117]